MLTVNKKDLQKALSPLAKIVSASGMPIYEFVLLNCKKGESIMDVTCSNGNVFLTIKFALDHCSQEGFAVCTGYRLLTDLLKQLPDTELLLETKEDRLHLDWGSGKSTLYTTDWRDFPAPSLIKTSSFDGYVHSGALLRALSCVAGATANEDFGRPALSSVLFDSSNEKLNLVASDTHQLICASLPASLTEGMVLLPFPAANSLKAVLTDFADVNIDITADDSHVCLRCDAFSLTSNVVSAKFPNYKAVIPDNPQGTVVIENSLLIKAIKRAYVFSNKAVGNIKLSFSEGKIDIQTEDVGYGMRIHESIPCDYSGQEIIMMVNAPLLVDVLRSISSENVEIAVTAPLRPLRIRPEVTERENETRVALVMPTK